MYKFASSEIDGCHIYYYSVVNIYALNSYNVMLILQNFHFKQCKTFFFFPQTIVLTQTVISNNKINRQMFDGNPLLLHKILRVQKLMD